MRFLGYLFYWAIQLSWGAIQTLFGFVLFLKYRSCEHSLYHGAILTVHHGDWGGVSLGPFIFVCGNRGEEYVQRTAVHEFGHTIQSLILGVFYLFVVGIPSYIWCNSKKCKAVRLNCGVKYTSRFPENWANRLGEAITHNTACDD